MDRLAHDSQLGLDRPAPPLSVWWLGRTAYRDAWDLQHRLVAARTVGLIGDQLLLVEHEPVLTLGRHSDPSHVVASPSALAARHIELIETERGGEVTYHGPGQLTGYPIVKLADRGLLVRPLVRALESALAGACASLGVAAGPKPDFPGCWCGDGMRKIGAVGVRIEHGVSYHGVALNVTASLADFELIDACGMPGVESTSIDRELGRASEPSTESVGRAAAAFAVALAGAMNAPLVGSLPPLADPVAGRAELEALLAAVAAPADAPTDAAPADAPTVAAPAAAAPTVAPSAAPADAARTH
jgi:lipoyl(octanoyl) transferase